MVYQNIFDAPRERAILSDLMTTTWRFMNQRVAGWGLQAFEMAGIGGLRLIHLYLMLSPFAFREPTK